MNFKVENGPRWSTLRVKPLRPLCETHVFVMQSILGASAGCSRPSWDGRSTNSSPALPYPARAGNDISCLRSCEGSSSTRHTSRSSYRSSCFAFAVCRRRSEAFLDAAQACRKMESELGHGDVRAARSAGTARATDEQPERQRAGLRVGHHRAHAEAKARGGGRHVLGHQGRLASNARHVVPAAHRALDGSHRLAAGYSDPTNFSRKFKYWYRVAPSKMRQTLRSGLH